MFAPQVSKAEFVARIKDLANGRPQWIAAFRKATADRKEDHEGGIIAAVTSNLEALFELYDTDRNGWLDESEVLVVVKALKPEGVQLDVQSVELAAWDATGDKKVMDDDWSMAPCQNHIVHTLAFSLQSCMIDHVSR